MGRDWGLEGCLLAPSASNKFAFRLLNAVPVVLHCCSFHPSLLTCVSQNEFDSIYSEVLRTTSPYATITRLEPGQSYRFRVHGVATSTASSHTPDEVEEVKGPASEPVIVHTLLETPAVPVIKAITSNSVHLCWRPRNLSLSTRSAKFINKMVGDWTHSDGLGAGGGAGGATAATGPAQGVSIEQAFMKYDSNHSGDIGSHPLNAVR